MVNFTAQWLIGFAHYPSKSKLLILSMGSFCKIQMMYKEIILFALFYHVFIFSLSPGNFCPKMATQKILRAHWIFLNCSFSSSVTVVEELHLHFVKKKYKSLNILLSCSSFLLEKIKIALRETVVNTYKAEETLRENRQKVLFI